MPEYAHLHENTAAVIDRDTEERIDWLRHSRWIGYPRAQDAITKLEELLRYPKQSRMPNMLLVGATNNGKTRIIEHFLQRHPPDENPGAEHINAPVVCVQAPPSPSEAGLYSNILTMLFQRVPSSSKDANRERVIELLRDVQTKMLIIDELHNSLAGSSVRQQEFLNVIKYLSNALNIVVVGCGTGDVLRAMGVDPQLQNRFPPYILPRWRLDTEFRQLLMSFETILPLKEASGLHEKPLASKILAMSEGTIGEVSELLNRAATLAIRSGSERITSSSLSACGYVPPSDRADLAARVD